MQVRLLGPIVVDTDDGSPVAQGKYVADRIAGADFLPLDSDVHLICVSDVFKHSRMQ